MKSSTSSLEMSGQEGTVSRETEEKDENQEYAIKSIGAKIFLKITYWYFVWRDAFQIPESIQIFSGKLKKKKTHLEEIPGKQLRDRSRDYRRQPEDQLNWGEQTVPTGLA